MTTVMICEKPDAAKKIAYAIADGKVKHVKSGSGVVYFEFEKNNETHFAVPAVGHIFGLKDVSGKGWTYPVFKLEWFPIFQINKKSVFSKKYFDTIQEVATKGNKFIVATDLDEEGSLIGWNILKFICKKNDGMRMLFSTLTKQDLIEAYKNISKHLDFSRIESGLTRHILDYLWGINISRALTLSIKNAGKKLSYHVLSAGRVQTPMLYFLIKREKEIAAFKPKPYWELESHILSNPKIIAYHQDGKFWEESKVKDILMKCKNSDAIVDIVIKKKIEKQPPFPFDLTSLQTEAYRFFGFSPKRTLNIAQNLYTAGYISYPRTSSQKLPIQIGYRNIIEQLSKIKPYEKICKKLLMFDEIKPNEGKKTDAAHPAIYPTSEIPDISSLKPEERKVYDLIVRRFLSTFGKPAIRESTNISFNIANEIFKATGSRTIENNWMEFYGVYSKIDEIEFPELKEGDRFKVEKINLLTKETQPPPRYSQGSIIKELEKHNLGTKTTRATILQTLYDRGYIEGKSIQVTSLGMKVGNTLAKYTPELVSEKLTRDFEKAMEKISNGEIKKDIVIKKAENVIKKISKEFKENEQKLGLALEAAIIEMKDKKLILGSCPKCQNGQLKIFFSPFTKKRFVGCSNYNKCIKCGFTKTACKCICDICGKEKGKCKCTWKEKKWEPLCNLGYPLPLKGVIEPLEKICEHCKSPIIKVIRQGMRPFIMCLDPKCKTKEDWLDKEKLSSNNKADKKQKESKIKKVKE